MLTTSLIKCSSLMRYRNFLNAYNRRGDRRLELYHVQPRRSPFVSGMKNRILDPILCRSRYCCRSQQALEPSAIPKLPTYSAVAARPPAINDYSRDTTKPQNAQHDSRIFKISTPSLDRMVDRFKATLPSRQKVKTVNRKTHQQTVTHQQKNATRKVE